MTNYMELLMTNQPWNLIVYMAVPVILAESVVATEFYSMFWGNSSKTAWHRWNKVLSILAGVYFTGIFLYLMICVVPTIQWRGYADIIAVGAYLLGVVPLGAIALLELGAWGRTLTARQHIHRHFLWVILFLVVSHIAMIFGMVDPAITGWQAQGMADTMEMTHPAGMDMNSMQHDHAGGMDE